VGWSIVLAHEAELNSSMNALGVDSDQFRDYILSTVNLGFFFNCAVAATALCTTGWCRTRIFKGGNRGCCFKTFQCFMGPLAQSLFFLFAMAFTIMFFVAFMVCTATGMMGLYSRTACDVRVNATVVPSDPDQDISYCMVYGRSFISPVLHHILLPRMISNRGIVFSDDKIDDICSASNDLVNASKFAAAAFGLMLFAQILFLIKITHSFTSILFDMSYDSPLNVEEVQSLVHRELDQIRNSASRKKRNEARV